VIGVAPREYTGGMRGLSVDAWIPILVSRTLSIGESGNWTEQRGSRGLCRGVASLLRAGGERE